MQMSKKEISYQDLKRLGHCIYCHPANTPSGYTFCIGKIQAQNTGNWMPLMTCPEGILIISTKTWSLRHGTRTEYSIMWLIMQKKKLFFDVTDHLITTLKKDLVSDDITISRVPTRIALRKISSRIYRISKKDGVYLLLRQCQIDHPSRLTVNRKYLTFLK